MDKLEKSILAAVLSILVCVAILGNLLIIISGFTHKVLRGPSHILILNLAVSDFLLSASCLPLRLKDLHDARDATSPHYCFAAISLSVSLFGASNFNLFLLTVDRFFGVVYPLLHKLKSKKRPVRRAIIVSWSVAFLVGFLPYTHPVFRGNFGKEDNTVCTYGSALSSFYFVIVVLFTLYLPLLIMIVLYVFIVKAVLRSLNFTKRHSSASRSSDANRRGSIMIWASSKEVRLAKGVLVILGVYTLSLGPIAVVDMLRLVSQDVPQTMLQFAVAMAYINPTLNPPIYAASCEDYRKCCMHVLTFGGRVNWGRVKLRILGFCRVSCKKKEEVDKEPSTEVTVIQNSVHYNTKL